MKKDKDVLFIDWCAKDALDGTLQLAPMTELAYRRVLDMIYVTEDNLVDDDSVLQYSTKTGNKWKSIKHELVEVHKKIYIENGFIRNKKCTSTLQKVDRILGQKSKAGKVSAEKRKALKNNNTTSTAVEEPFTEPLPENTKKTSTQRQLTKNQEEIPNGISTPLPPVAGGEAFDEFWETFPRQRRGNRKKAQAAWRQALNRAPAETILHGLSRYAESEEVAKGFAKGATAWLNDDRWASDYETKPQKGGTDGSKGNADAELRAFLERPRQG